MTALSQSCDHIVQIFSPTEIAGLILCTRQVPCGKDPGYIIPLASGLCRSLSLEAYSLLFLLNLFFIINTSLLLNVRFFFFPMRIVYISEIYAYFQLIFYSYELPFPSFLGQYGLLSALYYNKICLPFRISQGGERLMIKLCDCKKCRWEP